MGPKRRTTSRVLSLAALALLLAAGAAAAGGGSDDDATAASSGDAPPVHAEAGTKRGASDAPAKVQLANPLLDERSVVLITGAAGFLGSELALALRRTYSVHKLLLVDDLGIISENESSYVPPPPDKAGKPTVPIYEKFTERELGAFEIKRQRAFRIFHELTAPSYLDSEDEEEENSEGFGGSVGGKLGGAESVRFYRADMRPSIPEFFDFGEVPLLEGIFQSHPDITHVVHLADVPVSEQNQAIPRRKDSVKTGRFEGLLEEFRLVLERAAEDGDGRIRVPQLVYASTHDVYDQIPASDRSAKATRDRPNPPPFREDKPITTPSSLHGTAKLIDEVLASAYHSTHGIYSVGLRFFPVYGPWSSPGTEVFDLAERVAALNEGGVAEGSSASMAYEGDVKDYVYIDDAVDAILSAMQYRPPGEDPPPVVFNVGTGKGSTLGELREAMSTHFPKLNKSTPRTANPAHADRVATQSIASTSRSEALLGFKAQVPLSEGLARTLAWHRDRALPYGRDASDRESLRRASADRAIADSLDRARGEECSPLDRECARGAPVFPCASECRRPEKCTPSSWDEAASRSAEITEGCHAVLYTVLLDDDAEQIPSAVSAAAGGSSYVGAGLPDDAGTKAQARCNIAFVSDSSLLVKRLRNEGEEYLDEEESEGGNEGIGSGGNLPPLLRHGFWTVIPVKTSDPASWTHAFDGTHSLEYLPKLSPGRFFAPSVKYAAYSCPSVLVEDLPALLKMVEEGPPLMDGSTALFIAEARPSNRVATWQRPVRNDSVQQGAYNMVRAALRRDVLGGGLEPSVDSSFVVHLLREEDARLFRCDAYGEAAQWGAQSDGRALEFIVSLHDLWSRAVSHWSGQPAWWNAEGTNSGAANADGDGATDGDDVKEEAAEDEEGGEQRRLTDTSGETERTGKWMGILSSTEVQLFTHLVPPEGAGIIHLEDGEYSR